MSRLASCLWILLAAVGALPALHAADGLQRDFDRLDRNRDGSLDWPEFRARGIEVFYFADLDSNGWLGRDEAPRGLARRFVAIDRDGDGLLGIDEVENEHQRMFEAADRDRNGLLSREEVDALPGAGRRTVGGS